MGGPRFVHRITIVRRGRRLSLCGLRGYRARARHAIRGAKRRTQRAGLWPGATLALIVVFAAFALGNPQPMPDNPGRRTPIVDVAHYTFADFANANH